MSIPFRPFLAPCLSALSLALLAGCASKAELTPVAPDTLPPAPYGRTVPLTAEELLAVPPMAAPERQIELRRDSEVRQDDPFDLPPPR